jgi:hypothetical protein
VGCGDCLSPTMRSKIALSESKGGALSKILSRKKVRVLRGTLTSDGRTMRWVCEVAGVCYVLARYLTRFRAASSACNERFPIRKLVARARPPHQPEPVASYEICQRAP